MNEHGVACLLRSKLSHRTSLVKGTGIYMCDDETINCMAVCLCGVLAMRGCVGTVRISKM